MRPWLVLMKSELPFEENRILLDVPGYKKKLLSLSPAGQVPVLSTPEGNIPDSLAICDWLSQAVPNLWPVDAQNRKMARALCRQMQDDFTAFRQAAPMNLKRRKAASISKEGFGAAARLDAIWQDLLSRHDGPFLFGDWSIADAFSTPYATRFVSYDIPRSAQADTYISELMSDEDFLIWEAAALAEPWIIEETDTI